MNDQAKQFKQLFSVMFHHFHDDKHKKSQGSITAAQFESLLHYLNEKYQLLNADEYCSKYLKDKLEERDLCLTFDDSLLCQYDIAVPILKQFKKTAFFFTYTSPLQNEINYFEIHRRFRNDCFASVQLFYERFFAMLEQMMPAIYAKAQQSYPQDYLSFFPFYSAHDKLFRYIRDEVLTEGSYNEIMLAMMKEENFSIEKTASNLWVNSAQVKEMADAGHLIGLHSHSHPFYIHKLTYEQQLKEYTTNFNVIKEATGITPLSMSHPNGHYNEDSLTILKNLGIKIGFRSSLSVPYIKSALEIPRDDHSNLIRELSL